MKIFLIIAISINSCFLLASDCEVSEKQYARAIELRERSQFLLSSFHLSQAIALNCNHLDKYRYEYSKNMIALGEKIEALTEFNKISKNSQFYKKSQLQKKLFLGSENTLSKSDNIRYQVWTQRNNPKSLESLELKDLTISQQQAVNSYITSTRNIKLKNPGLAASLSIIPGLGQTYLGTYQSAAISFTLNSLFLLAAKDFERQKQYGAAAASYMVFSITYVGNILNTYRSANNINNGSFEKHNDQLWEELFQDL